jgi:hypothetical protein
MRVIHTTTKQINPYFGSLVQGLKSHGIAIDGEQGHLSIRHSLGGHGYDIVRVHFVSDNPWGSSMNWPGSCGIDFGGAAFSRHVIISDLTQVSTLAWRTGPREFWPDAQII